MKPFAEFRQSVWKSKIFQTILRGGAWMAVATIFAQFAGLVSSILVARILGVEEFGKYGILNETVLAFATIATRSMQVTATKFLAQYKRTEPEKAGRLCGLCWASSVGIGVLIGLFVFSFAGPLSTWVGSPPMKGLFQVGALSVVLSAVLGVQSGMILAFQRLKFLAVTSIIFAAFKPALLPLLCYLYGLVGFVWGLVFISCLNWVVNSSLLRRCFRESGVTFTFKGMREERAVLWKFTLPHALGTLVNMPVTWLSVMLLARSPNGVTEVAIFTAVQRWRKVILFLPATISNPSIPILAESFGQGKYTRAAKVMLGTVGINAFVCGLIAVGLAVASPHLLGLFGPEFREQGVTTMIVFLVAAFIQALIVPLGNVVGNAGRNWNGLIGTMLRAGTLLGVAYWLVPLGSVGLAWAHVSSAAVLLLFTIGTVTWIFAYKKAV